MNIEGIRNKLLEGFYSQIEELVLASIAAGVPFSSIRIYGPEFKSEDYSVWLEGGILYV